MICIQSQSTLNMFHFRKSQPRPCVINADMLRSDRCESCRCVDDVSVASVKHDDVSEKTDNASSHAVKEKWYAERE